MKREVVRLIGISVLAAVAGTGCSRMNSQNSMPSHSMHQSKMMSSKESATSAADLRIALNSLLGEHVLIAAVATSHALGGRDAAFKGAVGGLDANSVDLSRAIGSVYGPDAEKAFLPLWRKHIGFFVDYTTGVATKDKAKQEKAVADLVSYSSDFGAFLNSANPNLPKNIVADLVKGHILTLKEVVDAQAAGDWPKAYAATRSAYGHMHMIGDPLAAAIAKQFPQKFSGAVDSPAANLRNTLNLALREHAIIAAMATGSALGGRDAEFKAAAGALDANSVDISKAIGSVYGADAEKAFLPLWRKHIGFVVDYTTGLATKDKAKQDKAVTDLIRYADDFGAFLSSANPNLPKNAVADLVKGHILTLKDVVDAQAAKEWPKVYGNLRLATSHMAMIADPLGMAIAKQFPEKYAKGIMQ
jgi:copper chaperone CopZ